MKTKKIKFMKKIILFVVLLASMLVAQLVNAQSVTITTNPSPAVICAGQGTVVSLTANGTGNVVIAYAWSNNSTNQSINVSPAGTTTYTVTVTFMGGATASASATVTVLPAPAQATITPAGPTTICTGNTVQLNASAMDTYQWFHNGNIIPGATNQTYFASTSGDYTVIGTIGNCNVPMSAITTVNIIPLPTANITPTGPLTTCYGTTITLTADPVTGANYQWWYSPTGLSGSWSIIMGATNQTYNASTSGYYGVQVTVGACTNRSFIP